MQTAISGICLLSGFIAHKSGATDILWRGLLVISMVAGGYEASIHSVKQLPRGQLDIHFLMIVVGIGAAAIGAWEEGALLLFLFILSETMVHYAQSRTRRELHALFKTAPSTAQRIRKDGTEEIVDVEEL